MTENQGPPRRTSQAIKWTPVGPRRRGRHCTKDAHRRRLVPGGRGSRKPARSPIGQRIIEVPEKKTEDTELLRKSTLGFRWRNVPPGKPQKKGEALARTGSVHALCHGANLEGLGPVSRNCGPLSQLHRTPAFRYAGWYPQKESGQIS